MLKNLLFNTILCVSLGSPCIVTRAQSTFRYAAQLEEVKEPGFYQIELSPAVIAKLQPAFQDLRIVDEKGRQVPYMLQSLSIPGTGMRNTSTQIPIISKRIEADKQTHVVAENNLNSSINNLVLLIKNADATRTITISGSDDLGQWYVIKENVTLDKWYADTADTFARHLSFPNSNYRYLKIIIHGKDILPLNIIGVTVPVHGLPQSPGYIQVPSPSISQKDSSDGYSYIALGFNDFYWINRLSLHVSGTKFFRRNLYISDNNAPANEQVPYSLISNEALVYDISHKTNNILLKIQNDDNQALRLTGANAYQIKRSAITWLEKGNGYKLVFGDSLVTVPRYDLAFFKDSIKDIPVSLTHGKIEINNVLTQKETGGIMTSKIWIWFTIVGVLSILLLFTFRMMRDINKNP